jgi:predicted nucleic acid-binding protein
MISYDTNVLIYALESNNEFAASARKILFRGEAVGAVLSMVVKQELFTGMVLMGKNTSETLQAVQLLKSTKFVPVDDEIVSVAVELTKKYGRKCINYDALILATAIVKGATEFYTNDNTLCRAGITEIHVRSLV